MIFKPTKEAGTQTSLQPGDRIYISKDGDIVIVRQHGPHWVALTFVDHPGISGHYFAVKVEKGQMAHEYAWWIARAIAAVAGLFVEDNYILSERGHHDFPVLAEAPAKV